MLAHTFTQLADVYKGTPIFRCANHGCRVVWWPDRNRPRSVCNGTPASAAQDGE